MSWLIHGNHVEMVSKTRVIYVGFIEEERNVLSKLSSVAPARWYQI
jgi:hypothetical protein